MKRLGLDDGTVFRVITSLLLFFAICVPLFIMMIGLWSNSSSFANVIHSFFFASLGIYTNRTRINAADSEGKKADAQVNAIMKNLGETVSGTLR